MHRVGKHTEPAIDDVDFISFQSSIAICRKLSISSGTRFLVRAVFNALIHVHLLRLPRHEPGLQGCANYCAKAVMAITASHRASAYIGDRHVYLEALGRSCSRGLLFASGEPKSAGLRHMDIR